MSATSMGRLAAMRSAQIKFDVKGDHDADTEKLADEGNDSAQTPLGKVVAFIPSEAVTLYVGALAIVGPIDDSAQREMGLWAAAIGVIVVNALLTLLAFMQTTSQPRQGIALGKAAQASKFWFTLLLGTIAVVVYILVLPGNPILTESWWSALLVLFAGVGIPLVASLIGVTPVPKEQRATDPQPEQHGLPVGVGQQNAQPAR